MRDVRKGDTFLHKEDLYVILCAPFTQAGGGRTVIVSRIGLPGKHSNECGPFNIHPNGGVDLIDWGDCVLL